MYKNIFSFFRTHFAKHAVIPAVLIIFLTGCTNTGMGSQTVQPHKVTFFAMDTAMTITAYGDDSLFDNASSPLQKAQELVNSLESKFSVTDVNSIIYMIDHAGGNEVPIDAETADLLNTALDYCRKTDGALDISIYPVVRAWGFTTGVYRIPDDIEIERLLENVNYKMIRLIQTSGEFASYPTKDDQSGNTQTNDNPATDGYVKADPASTYSISVESNMMIDTGAVAKGYTAERIADLLIQSGVKSAVISLGGNIKTIGTKPDGSDWNIAVAAPDNNAYAGILKVSDMSVVTSGGYERYFEENGKHYCHIIDPSTGHPVDNGILSVTVVAGDSFLCDALSTALFVMGPEKAEEFRRNSLRDDQLDDFDYIMITGDNRIIITEGIKDRFTVDPTYSDYSISVIYP
ncbi:MAG: FAD:protein FMN transferase [Lachnospiraceae bacterium]|nr:FAD:protein FMN transferase [Lachnospiraceae bacterium]